MGAGQDIQNTVRDNAGNLQQLSSNLTGMLPQIQQQTIGSTTMQPGQNYLSDVLGGKYLGQGNPYMQGMIDQTANDVGGKVNATFSAAGRTGGGANQLMLTKGLADAENNLRYTDYNNERTAMNNAASLLPSYQAAQNNGTQSLLSAYQLAGQLPYYGTNALGNIGSLYSGYGKTTGTQPGGWGTDILNAGAMLGAAAIMHSDRRLKRNIRKVGEAKDGLGIYEWVYKADPSETVNRGVMADEVERLRPWAFVPNFRGEYAGVNYAALGSVE